MQYLVKTCGMLSLIWLSACSAVYSTAPVGDLAVQLSPEEWQGTWLGDEMVAVTTVLDAEKGLLQVAWIERRVEGAILETVQSTIRSSGDYLFANTRDNEAESPRYVWIRLDKTADKLTTWVPQLETFQSMVSEGQIPGTLTDDGVVLGELNQQQLEMINSPSSNLLDWQEPRVFIRISD